MQQQSQEHTHSLLDSPSNQLLRVLINGQPEKTENAHSNPHQEPDPTAKNQTKLDRLEKIAEYLDQACEGSEEGMQGLQDLKEQELEGYLDALIAQQQAALQEFALLDQYLDEVRLSLGGSDV